MQEQKNWVVVKMNISAREIDFKELNNRVRECTTDVIIDDCYGERFIGVGQDKKTITINGTPGNALGAYLNGADIVVNGNVQDAVGDTMNAGRIIVNGNAGDALGYAMRGGRIFVKGDAGYRTGIHMKEYEDKKPVIVVGGKTGCFLGEYLAGGVIIVLGLGCDVSPIEAFAGTGMHGGEIWIRSNEKPINLPKQVIVSKATKSDIAGISVYIDEFSELFGVSKDDIYDKSFYLLKPNAKNPYKQLYTEN